MTFSANWEHCQVPVALFVGPIGAKIHGIELINMMKNTQHL